MATDAGLYDPSWRRVFEVIFDESTPAKFSFEYVRRDHLIIPRDTKDIQACFRLARIYEVTKHQLSLLASAFGFDPSAVAKIKEHYRTKTEFIKIYKYFLRDDNNYVYNAWFADPDIGVDTYLREPMPHFLGDYSEPAPSALGFGASQPQSPRRSQRPSTQSSTSLTARRKTKLSYSSKVKRPYPSTCRKP